LLLLLLLCQCRCIYCVVAMFRRHWHVCSHMPSLARLFPHALTGTFVPTCLCFIRGLDARAVYA
jgi:hypothetical protein